MDGRPDLRNKAASCYNQIRVELCPYRSYLVINLFIYYKIILCILSIALKEYRKILEEFNTLIASRSPC